MKTCDAELCRQLVDMDAPRVCGCASDTGTTATVWHRAVQPRPIRRARRCGAHRSTQVVRSGRRRCRCVPNVCAAPRAVASKPHQPRDWVRACAANVDGAPVSLATKVQDGGRNWSVGQKQLLCLARALVRRARLVCIDEATASVRREAPYAVLSRTLTPHGGRQLSSQVDSATDALMQATIRTAFATSTVITVAHRLSTLRASDVIVVLSAGAVVEVGAPQDLLADPQSAFSTLHRGGSNSAGGSDGTGN